MQLIHPWLREQRREGTNQCLAGRRAYHPIYIYKFVSQSVNQSYHYWHDGAAQIQGSKSKPTSYLSIMSKFYIVPVLYGTSTFLTHHITINYPTSVSLARACAVRTLKGSMVVAMNVSHWANFRCVILRHIIRCLINLKYVWLALSFSNNNRNF